MTDELARLELWVTGQVQGVGFRAWTKRRARSFGLVGSATNLPDGRVHVIAEGTREACTALLERFGGWTPGHVQQLAHEWTTPEGGYTAFTTGGPSI